MINDSIEALKAISKHRNDEIVVTTFSTSREWPQVSTNPDLDLSVSSMGKASSFGLGLALALPDKKVLVLDGDGSLLLNLGTVVTIGTVAPPNLIHFVFENTIYRTTGGQPIPSAGKIRFIEFAKTARYANMHEFDDVVSLDNNMETILNQMGPTFVSVSVPPNADRGAFKAVPVAEVLPRFLVAIHGSS